MRTYVCAAALCAAAGAASADLVTSQAREIDVSTSLSTAGGENFVSVHDGFSPRVATAGASYNGSAAWGNASGGFAAVVSNGSPVPNNDVFDGAAQNYAGGAATQLGDNWGAIEFQGTTTGGVEFVQVNYFSLTGTTMDANAAGFGRIGMAAGVGFFVADGQDSINVDGPGFTFLSASFGFFDLSGNFLGSADISANNFSDANGLGAIGILDAAGAGLAGNIGEMFIQIQYEVIPAPASAALMGLGGLVACRRRR